MPSQSTVERVPSVSEEPRVYLLAPPRVEVGDSPLPVPCRQVRALLYRLAAQPGPIPREQLCFLFWPDTPLDADGVALAAIQGLYEQNQALEAENTELRSDVDELTARLTTLERAVTTRSPGAPSVPIQSSVLLGAGIIALAGVLVWGTRRQGGDQ